MPQKQVALETALRRSGFDVRTLPRRHLADGRLKANWDMELATDLMRREGDLDVIVLGTGDGDLVELVRWLREEGLQVHVASVAGHTAGELIAAQAAGSRSGTTRWCSEQDWLRRARAISTALEWRLGPT